MPGSPSCPVSGAGIYLVTYRLVPLKKIFFFLLTKEYVFIVDDLGLDLVFSSSWGRVGPKADKEAPHQTLVLPAPQRTAQVRLEPHKWRGPAPQAVPSNTGVRGRGAGSSSTCADPQRRGLLCLQKTSLAGRGHTHTAARTVYSSV